MTEEEAPYDVPKLRLKSLQIKDVKVKKEPAIRVTVGWEKQMDDGSWDAMRYASIRDPEVAFWKATQQTVPHVLALVDLPTDWPNVELVGLKFTYDDDDNQIATAVLRKLTGSGEGKVESPSLPNAGDYLVFQTDEYHQALLAVEAEALQFAAGIRG